MANNNTQDVELRIRATNVSKQTTDQVVASLKELTKAQDAQIESAKKGATTAAQLEVGYKKIEDAAKALISQQGLIRLFERQSEAADKSSQRLDAARKALNDYATSLDPAVSKTRAQEIQLKSLTTTVAGAEKAFASISARVSSTSDRLARFGIDANNLAAAEAKITTAVNGANAALERQDNAIGAVALRQQRLNALAAARAEQVRQQAAVDATFNAAAQAAANQAASASAAAAARTAAEIAQRERQVGIDVVWENEQRRMAAAAQATAAAVAAQAVAMNAAADAAARQARNTSGGARPGVSGPAASNIAGTVRDIASPAEAATRNVAGLEAAIASLETRVTAIRGPVVGYRDALRDAAQAQQALQTAAGRLDAYNNQITALRAARGAYADARVEVNRLIAEMRSGSAGADITTRLASAQSTLANAAAQLRNLTGATRESRDALRAAGVDTRNLGAAEADLVSQANRAAGALNSLNAAYRQHGAAVDNSRNSILSWFNGSRDQLSIAQRLKGELFALAAAYIGLNAAINLGKESLDAYSKFQSLNSRLLVAAGGNAKQAADEYAFLERASEKYSFVLLDIGASYAKFAIAAQASNFTLAETRSVFSNLAQGAKGAKLSTDEFKGVLLAFQQVVSKGKLSAEELNQLGERLPGAFSIAAKSLGITNAELSKQIALGNRTAFDVISIADGVGKTYGVVKDSAKTLTQAQADFTNATDRFKLAIADRGFVAAYTEFLSKLQTMISGSSGDQLASGIAGIFSTVLKTVQLITENLGYLEVALGAVIAVKFLGWLVSIPNLAKDAWLAIDKIRKALIALEGTMIAFSGANVLMASLGVGGLTGVLARLAPAIEGVAIAMGLLGKAIPYIGAAIVAYEVTSVFVSKADNKIRANVEARMKATQDAIEKATAAQKAADKVAGTRDEQDLQGKADKLKALAVQAVKDQAAAVKDAQDKYVSLEGVTPPKEPVAELEVTKRDKTAQLLERDQAKHNDAMAKLEQERIDIELAGVKKSLPDRLRLINERFAVQRQAAEAEYTDVSLLAVRLASIQKESDTEQANERKKFYNEQATTDESAAKKRIKIAQDINSKLLADEADIAKRRADQDRTIPFETREAAAVDAVSKAYRELGNQIIQQRALDPKAAAAAQARLDLVIKQRKEEERVTIKRSEATALEKEFNDLQEIQKSKIEGINALYEAGQISAARQLELINQAVEETAPGIEAAGHKALDFANKVRSMLDPVVYQKLIAEIGKGLSQAGAEAATTTNTISATQEQLNQTLARQAEAVDLISAKRKLGLIGSTQEAAELNANTTKYKALIDDLITSLQQLLTIQRDAGAISKESFDKQNAALTLLKTNTDNAVKAVSDLDGTIASSIAQNGVTAFEALATSIANVVSGTQSLGEGFRGAARAAGAFFAGLLRDIGLAIAKQLILNAIASWGGGIGAGAVKLGGVIAGGQHTGGITGQNASFKRNVDSAMFAGATRYHTGGIAGLAPNEVPAILQKGEEVLTRNDPRHVNNGGGTGAADAGTRFVLVDDPARVPQAMQSASGEKAIMVVLKNNLPTLKQWIK